MTNIGPVVSYIVTVKVTYRLRLSMDANFVFVSQLRHNLLPLRLNPISGGRTVYSLSLCIE